MSDGFAELIDVALHVTSAVCGAVLTLVVYSFKFGGKLAQFVTRKELDTKLVDYARKDRLDGVEARVEDLIDSVDSLRTEQREDFRTVIELVKGGK